MARQKVKTASYQVRIPVDVLKRIQAVAKRDNQSVNATMVLALSRLTARDFA